jgi:two-component system sensor kinase FixL
MATQLAHEINQPLGAIANFAGGLRRLLGSGKLEVEAARQAVEQINEQALRAGAVIRRLREFLRKEELRNERCFLGELVNDAVRFVDADARHRGVLLRVVSDCEPSLEVEVNRVQIAQVMINILTNALEAIAVSSRSPCEVVVETAVRDEGHVEVRVSDTGTGLPAGDAEQLFASFFTTKPHGLGMGLTISQSIIAAHGGAIWACSRPEGGATVGFTLPRCAAGE